MREVKLGFPEYITTKRGDEYVIIPPKEMGDLVDIGMTTAHELGHASMGHQRPPTTPRGHILQELEAWYWAVTKRGLTEADKAYFWSELVTDAESLGIGRDKLADLLKQAIRNVEARKYKE